MDQDPSRRSQPGWMKWLPGVDTALNYERSWLWPDLVAGLVLTALLVPQGMAYAELAGLPAVTGLSGTPWIKAVNESCQGSTSRAFVLEASGQPNV